MEAKSALQTLTSDDTVQSDISLKQDSYKSKDDYLRDQRDIQNSFPLPHFSQDSFKNPDCENPLEQSTSKKKINNYRELEETDLETSLTLAAEVGNALLLENTELKKDINRLLSKITELNSQKISLEQKLHDFKQEKSAHDHDIEDRLMCS
ncbi:hypothetical protein J6590_025762 [Homalodisca vitripennis]|nr:hypothetical protein J6590_025762 [Homalodisca vitripennis]